MQEVMTFISSHLALTLGIAFVFLLVIVVEALRARRGTLNLNPVEVTQKINHDDAVIIDVRPIEAYRKGHIIGSHAISAAEIRENVKKIDKYKAKPIIVVCNAGIESQKIATLLLKHGYNAYSLSGGIRGWMDAQMPLVKE